MHLLVFSIKFEDFCPTFCLKKLLKLCQIRKHNKDNNKLIFYFIEIQNRIIFFN